MNGKHPRKLRVAEMPVVAVAVVLKPVVPMVMAASSNSHLLSLENWVLLSNFNTKRN